MQRQPAPPRRRWLALALAGLATPAIPAPRVLTAGPGARLAGLRDALRVATDGDTIELLPGDYRGDVGVAEQRRLRIRGLGTGAVLHADGRHAEGKAILVCRGDVTVENLEFRGCRVPSGNGAGIRFESGRLAVRRCRFFDNEMGLLSANDAGMRLSVEDCEFGQAPHHEGLLHHLLYVGSIGHFELQGSRLSGGWRGHLVKSRARESRIRGNLLDDGAAGEASYELEFPEGGQHLVVGNVIVQSARSQNPAIVSMGAEARGQVPSRLVLAHNTIVNAAGPEARFVHVWFDRLPADSGAELSDNLFVGSGAWLQPGLRDDGGNHQVERSALRDPDAGDYRLAVASPWRGSAGPLRSSLWPLLEFAAPLGTRPAPPGRLAPGALQSDD